MGIYNKCEYEFKPILNAKRSWTIITMIKSKDMVELIATKNNKELALLLHINVKALRRILIKNFGGERDSQTGEVYMPTKEGAIQATEWIKEAMELRVLWE